MNSQIWGCLSAQEFFGNFNWPGNPQQDLLAIQFSQSSWLGLTVEDFFNQNNWQGTARKSQVTRSLSITMPVGEFFGIFGWENQTYTVASSIPKSAPKKPVASSDDFTIANLSNLF
jgi:hypothetical protein